VDAERFSNGDVALLPSRDMKRHRFRLALRVLPLAVLALSALFTSLEGCAGTSERDDGMAENVRGTGRCDGAYGYGYGCGGY
jgi:hypothetical protein